MSQNFQAPVKYEPPTTVLAKLGIADERSQSFVFAQAAIMKVDPGHLDIPENIAEVIKSVQYTRQYGFMPGIHLHMTPFRTKAKRKLENGNTVEVWEDRVQLVVGEQAYKAAARIQANKEGDHIEFEWEALKPEELSGYIAETMPKDFELTDEDRGVRARVLSFKSAQMAKAMDRKYDPEWSYGFCFMKGLPRLDNSGKKSYPKGDRDRIPSQRTALDVAVRRAIKNAIMKQYHLTPIDGRTEEQRMNDVMVTAAQEEARAAERNIMFAPRADLREEDGDVAFDYGAPAHRNGANQAPPAEDEIEDGLFESAKDTSPDEPIDILADPNVNDAVKGFVESLRNLEQPGAKHASDPQYKYAVGVIDGICGKGSHSAVFQALFNRDVTKGTPIAAAAAQHIFKRLCETQTAKDEDGRPVKDETGKPVKVENPDYDAQDVAILCEVNKWAVAQGAVPA